ncbi:YiiD C-terminal domain-containing protein [Pseudomonas sp. NW5]|uniref:YiiD C-terminal domain-containing protein n=1 Tax=Pseudomonas sp. NW5 TaxID=2934934 RepID=UPI002020B787|nr:thioesterase domain-containing protein [Pseudomonas sp. NW5]
MTCDHRPLETLLHDAIPLTRAMGLKVLGWQDHELRLSVPLAPNINHTGSMFGGSLYSSVVLAGWGWLTLRLREAGIEDGVIVIKGGQIDYPLPVIADAQAVCAAPPEDEWRRFEALYRRRGLARLYLDSRIVDAEGAVAVTLRGEYVLQRQGTPA